MNLKKGDTLNNNKLSVPGAKTYTPPALKVYGPIKKLTLKEGINPDGSGMGS